MIRGVVKKIWHMISLELLNFLFRFWQMYNRTIGMETVSIDKTFSFTRQIKAQPFKVGLA